MKKCRTMMSLIFTLLIAALVFTACTGNSAPVESGDASTPAPAPAEAEAPEPEPEAEAPEPAAAEPEAPAEPAEVAAESAETGEVNFLYMLASGNNATDLPLIEEELDRIAMEKINAHLNMEAVVSADYTTTVALKLSSGEPLDLLVVGASNISTWANNETILPITTLLDSHGAGAKAALGEYWNSGSMNGEVYVIPTIRDLCRGGGLNTRTDLLEKYNIDVTSLTELSDMTEVFRIIKEGEGENFYPLEIANPGSVFLGDYNITDPLSDGFGVLLDCGLTNTEVVLFQESQQYKDHVRLLSEWFAAGYVQPDIATTQEGYSTLMKTGNYLCWPTNSKPGISQTAQRNTGYEITTIQFLPYFATSSQVLSFNYGIAQSAISPEKTMEFLNLMYTDPDVVTTLSFGIEDVHYQTNADGLLDYLDGKDSSTTGWSVNTSWLNGNQFMCRPWVTEGFDLWDKQDQANKDAAKSLALGFLFDNSNVQAEVAACTNVSNEYKRQIESGLDPAQVDTMIDAYVSALKAAGVEKIIAEKQAQLDAWLAAQA